MFQYGWICPKCGRVYAPTQIICLYCNNETGFTSDKTTDPFKYKIDCINGPRYDDSLKAYYESVSVTKPTNKTTCCETTCSKLNTDSKENYNSIVEDFYAEYY